MLGPSRLHLHRGGAATAAAVHGHTRVPPLASREYQHASRYDSLYTVLNNMFNRYLSYLCVSGRICSRSSKAHNTTGHPHCAGVAAAHAESVCLKLCQTDVCCQAVKHKKNIFFSTRDLLSLNSRNKESYTDVLQLSSTVRLVVWHQILALTCCAGTTRATG